MFEEIKILYGRQSSERIMEFMTHSQHTESMVDRPQERLHPEIAFFLFC